MEKAYEHLKTHSNLIGSIILCCAAFSSVITLERPDYNLFLFVFIAYTMFWKENELKSIRNVIILERMFFTIVFFLSLVVDCIWICTHSDLCSSFIIYLSRIEFVIKILVFIIVLIMWQGYKKESSSPELEGTGFKELDEEAQNNDL